MSPRDLAFQCHEGHRGFSPPSKRVGGASPPYSPIWIKSARPAGQRKIAFMSHGTLGDYQPAALVCGELAARGHDTVFMAPLEAKHLVQRYPGVRFVDFGISMEDARENTIEGKRLSRLNVINHRRRLLDYFKVLEKDWAPKAIQFIEEEQPDLVVLTIGSLLFLAPVFEALGVPTVSLLANPMHTTGEHLPTMGPQVMRSLHFPSFNKQLWRYMWNNQRSMVMRTLRGMMTELPIDEFAREQLRAYRPKDSTPLNSCKLILCSKSFYPAPKDWDDNTARVIGVAWVPDEVAKTYRNPELEAFMNKQQALAYVGFGSMLSVYRENKHRLRLLNTCVQSCLALGLSVVVNTTGSKGFVNPDPSRVMTVAHIPHNWLFPRCSVIIHHGGSGTTHTVLKAARPQVIVPFYFPTWYYNGVEQGFWCTQVRQSGVGDGILHANLATKEKITHLIQKALRPTTVERVRMVSMRISEEDDGLQIACDILEKMLLQPEDLIRDGSVALPRTP